MKVTAFIRKTSAYNRENEMYNLTKRNVQLGAFSA